MLRTLLIPIVLALGSVGCGAPQTASAPPSPTAASPSTAETPPQEKKPVLPSCDDRTCSKCGDGLCPSGWYCEANGASTGCAWNPSCAKTPSCGCLKSIIKQDPRCRCEDRDGVAFVTCGG